MPGNAIVSLSPKAEKLKHQTIQQVFSTLAMSKIWAAVSVQCQAFLIKDDFVDSE